LLPLLRLVLADGSAKLCFLKSFAPRVFVARNFER